MHVREIGRCEREKMERGKGLKRERERERERERGEGGRGETGKQNLDSTR